MSRYRPSSARRVVADLRAFADYLEDPSLSDLRHEVADWLNAKLDDLLQEDAFGTEGQCDPRGDHRS